MAHHERRISENFNIHCLTENRRLTISCLKENRDVFIGTQTGSGKSLTYECVPLVFGETAVTVVTPLVNIMKEQLERLSSYGYRAVYIEVKELQAATTTSFVLGRRS